MHKNRTPAFSPTKNLPQQKLEPRTAPMHSQNGVPSWTWRKHRWVDILTNVLNSQYLLRDNSTNNILPSLLLKQLLPLWLDFSPLATCPGDHDSTYGTTHPAMTSCRSEVDGDWWGRIHPCIQHAILMCIVKLHHAVSYWFASGFWLCHIKIISYETEG